MGSVFISSQANRAPLFASAAAASLYRLAVAGVFLLASHSLSAAETIHKQESADAALPEILCSRIRLAVSPDGSRALAHDGVMNQGAFVSSAPFGESPEYFKIGQPTELPWWAGDGRVVFEQGSGHIVFDLANGSKRIVDVDASSNRTRFSHGRDVLPHLVGSEFLVIADGSNRNVRAVNIDTGKSRIVIEGSAGKDYPLHLFVSADGREIAREYQTEGRAGTRFVFSWRRSKPTLQLDPWESLDPLITSENFALSNKERFLAVHTEATGSRAVVSVDARTLRWKEVLKLSDALSPALGLSPDGTEVEWYVDFTPLPSVAFTRHAPRSLVEFGQSAPNAMLSFQSQSRDGRTQIVKLKDLAGRVRFARIRGGAIDELSVPCRQPETTVTTEEIAPSIGGDGGWVVHWRRPKTSRGRELATVIVFPDRPVGAVRLELDPVFESMVADGADLHLLIYPGSWPSAGKKSGSATGQELLQFAKAASDKAIRTGHGRRVLLVGYGMGASVAFRLASTSLAGRVDGIFAISASPRALPLPLVEKRGKDSAPSSKYLARDVSAVFFHGAADPSTEPSEIERIVRDRHGDARINRCIVVEGMDTPEVPFHWRQEAAALQSLLDGVMSKATSAAASNARSAEPKCSFVKL